MISSEAISVAAGVAAALIFIFFLTKKKPSGKNVKKPSLVKSFAAFFEGDDKKALEEMKTLALSDQGSPEIYLSIGFLYRKLGDYGKAAQIHEVLAGNRELDREYKTVLAGELAKDYMMAGAPVRALLALKEFPEAENDPENLIILAKASLEVGHYDNALAYHEKYCRLTGKSLQGFVCKCRIEKAIASKDPSKSAKYIKTALVEFPQCRPARFIKAGLLAKDGKFKKAAEEYESLLKEGLLRDPEDMDAIWKEFVAAGEESRLLALLKKLTEENTGNPLIYIGLGKYYEGTGDKEAALDLFEKYITRRGPSPIIAFRYAALSANPVIQSIAEGKKIYECVVCKTSYDEYHDDCFCCGSFDSIYIK